MITSTNEGKACDKIQYSFRIKILRKLGIEGSFLNLLKKTHIYKTEHNKANQPMAASTMAG